MQNSDFKTRLTSVYGSQTSPVGLSTHNSVLSSRKKRLYVFQPSPVVLCMQNSDFSTRITSLCGSKTPPVVFECKTATFGPELQVCVGPRPHLWVWAHITACLAQEKKGYMCSSLHLWFCACKTATLAPELQVSVGPRPHLWFLNAKQLLLDQNYKSLWDPDLTCLFVHA